MNESLTEGEGGRGRESERDGWGRARVGAELEERVVMLIREAVVIVRMSG